MFALVIGWYLVYWVCVGAVVPYVAPVNPPSNNWGDFCRPQCYMSGTFHDTVIRSLEPWPFRKNMYFECPKRGDVDKCTGEIYNGDWWFKIEK
jgi:hypothetical protein